jgi:hypothetical protein
MGELVFTAIEWSLPIDSLPTRISAPEKREVPLRPHHVRMPASRAAPTTCSSYAASNVFPSRSRPCCSTRYPANYQSSWTGSTHRHIRRPGGDDPGDVHRQPAEVQDRQRNMMDGLKSMLASGQVSLVAQDHHPSEGKASASSTNERLKRREI